MYVIYIIHINYTNYIHYVIHIIYKLCAMLWCVSAETVSSHTNAALYVFDICFVKMDVFCQHLTC